MLHHRAISTFALSLRWLLVWSVALGAIAMPWVYERDIERAGDPHFNLAAENRAAVALNGWELAGRLKVDTIDDFLVLDLCVPRADWERLQPAERQALRGRLARAVIRGVPIGWYRIRDDDNAILLQGPGNPGSLQPKPMEH